MEANVAADLSAMLIPFPVTGAILPAESPTKNELPVAGSLILKLMPLMVSGSLNRNSAALNIFFKCLFF